MKYKEKEVLNSKQQVLNKLGLDSEKELSNENVKSLPRERNNSKRF